MGEGGRGGGGGGQTVRQTDGRRQPGIKSRSCFNLIKFRPTKNCDLLRDAALNLTQTTASSQAVTWKFFHACAVSGISPFGVAFHVALRHHLRKRKKKKKKKKEEEKPQFCSNRRIKQTWLFCRQKWIEQTRFCFCFCFLFLFFFLTKTDRTHSVIFVFKENKFRSAIFVNRSGFTFVIVTHLRTSIGFFH